MGAGLSTAGSPRECRRLIRVLDVCRSSLLSWVRTCPCLWTPQACRRFSEISGHMSKLPTYKSRARKTKQGKKHHNHARTAAVGAYLTMWCRFGPTSELCAKPSTQKTRFRKPKKGGEGQWLRPAIRSARLTINSEKTPGKF